MEVSLINHIQTERETGTPFPTVVGALISRFQGDKGSSISVSNMWSLNSS